jgi:two-component system response regulator YesN
MVWGNPRLSIDDMANRLSLNRVYLSALFKRARGMAAEEYRTRVRVEMAKEMLVKTDESLIEVADHAGYESVSMAAHWCRAQTAGLRRTGLRCIWRADLI